MRTYEEYERILTLWESGENKKAIARITGIPRATVRDFINRYGSLGHPETLRMRFCIVYAIQKILRLEAFMPIYWVYTSVMAQSMNVILLWKIGSSKL